MCPWLQPDTGERERPSTNGYINVKLLPSQRLCCLDKKMSYFYSNPLEIKLIFLLTLRLKDQTNSYSHPYGVFCVPIVALYHSHHTHAHTVDPCHFSDHLPVLEHYKLSSVNPYEGKRLLHRHNPNTCISVNWMMQTSSGSQQRGLNGTSQSSDPSA